jgi:hypothetical protein
MAKLNTVTVSTERPPEGDYRVMVTIVDAYGTARSADFVVGQVVYNRLTERHSWDQYFYPALLRLKGSM